MAGAIARDSPQIEISGVQAGDARTLMVIVDGLTDVELVDLHAVQPISLHWRGLYPRLGGFRCVAPVVPFASVKSYPLRWIFQVSPQPMLHACLPTRAERRPNEKHATTHHRWCQHSTAKAAAPSPLAIATSASASSGRLAADRIRRRATTWCHAPSSRFGRSV
jgi:hypothetical protein